jgi:hypothetical protein
LPLFVVTPNDVDDPCTFFAEVPISSDKLFMGTTKRRHAEALVKPSSDSNFNRLLVGKLVKLHRIDRMAIASEVVNDFTQSVRRPAMSACSGEVTTSRSVAIDPLVLWLSTAINNPDAATGFVFVEALTQSLVTGSRWHTEVEIF